MNEMSDWFQNNWIDLARLLLQCAMLAAVVRYGRKLLAAIRASQEQVGALLRLSVSDIVAERPAAAPEPEPSTGYEPTLAPAPSRQYEPASVRYPAPRPERVAEPEPEPVFAGAVSRGGHVMEREQSFGGRLMGTQSPRFSVPSAGFATPSPSFSTQGPIFSAPVTRAESPSLTPWVSAPPVAPAIEPERMSVHTAPVYVRPGMSAWLKAPMRPSGLSPWRKMVRWLQAPVRS
jgi:hypothetical protein